MAENTKNPTAKADDDKADDKVSAAATRGLTTKQADELDALGVNPQLDNRTGDQRPVKVDFPAKPQHVDGPEVGQFREHAKKYGTSKDPKVDALGAKSKGPLGLGEGVEAKIAETN